MDVYPCATDKITSSFYAGLDINGFAVCHPFVASYTADVGSVIFWLKQHPDSANLPATVDIRIYNVDSDGLPIGSTITSGDVAVPAGLTLTGEEITATLDSTFEMVKGQNYGLVYWFAHEGGNYSIVIAGGELDTCPFESGGNTIPVIEAQHSKWEWEEKAGPCVPSYYKFVPAALDLQVYTNAATVVTKNSATLNGTIGYIPTGKVVTRRGFRYGTDENLSTYTEWSETGVFEVGAFSHDLTGLSGGTDYYFQAFACVTEETLGPTTCYADGHFIDLIDYANIAGDSQPTDAIWKDNPARLSNVRSTDADEVTRYAHLASTEFGIFRSVCRFDTSSIPSNAVITKATLHIKVKNGSYDLYLITFPTPSAWDKDILKASYWSEFVDGSYGDIVLTVGSYADWTIIDSELNATGRSHINKGGWTYFGWIHESDYNRVSLEVDENHGYQYANATYGGSGVAYLDIEYTV